MNNVRILDINEKSLPKLPKREPRSHKGSFGRLLCVCGSEGMSGAAYLSAKAAYRTGAGLVEILTCESNRVILQTLIPEAIVTAYDTEEPDIRTVCDAVCRADAIVIGCGLGRSRTAAKILGCVLRQHKCPMIIDADALNIISERETLIKYANGAIITPHFKEMSRLTGLSVEEISDNTAKVADDFAREHDLVCLLKDHRTAVSRGDGEVYLNTTGNSGMATGGSGDVLSGIIGGILAQNKDGALSALDVAVLSAYIHGLAGDIAADKLGEYSLMASDIINALPEAIKSLSSIQ